MSCRCLIRLLRLELVEMSGRVAPSNVVVHNGDDADIRCVPGPYCTWGELCCVAVHDHGGLFTGSQTMQYP